MRKPENKAKGSRLEEMDRSGEENQADELQHASLPFDPIPIEDIVGRRCVFDLEQAVNEYDRTIYVEERDEFTGKPKIWYEFDRQKILVKSVRSSPGIYITYLGKTKYL